MAEMKKRYYQRKYQWYDEEETRRIDQAYKQHREMLYNQLEKGNKKEITNNYQQAQEHYLKLYQHFSAIYRNKRTNNDFLKLLNHKLKMYKSKNIQGEKQGWQRVVKKFDDFLTTNIDGLGLEGKMLDIANNMIEDELKTRGIKINQTKTTNINSLKQLKQKNTNLIKKLKQEKDKLNQQAENEGTQWKKALDKKIRDEWNKQLNSKEISEMVLSKIGTKKSQYFSVNDIMSFIINPLIKQRKEKILNGIGTWSTLSNYNSALGFFYEACAAQAIGEVFEYMSDAKTQGSQVKVIHKAGKNEIEDIVVNFSQILTEEQRKNGYTEDFGIQVKGYDTLKMFDNFFNNNSNPLIEDPTKFIRFSNHADMLKDFRKTILPIQGEANIQSQEEYAIIQSEAMAFLSDNKKLFNILGEANVGYIERSGFKWTKDLLKIMINTRQWLCFESRFGHDFTERVGIL